MIGSGGYSIAMHSVLFNKELSDKEKIIYIVISGLCSQSGYCWANNRYFSEKLGITTSRVSNWINSLAKKGHIIIDKRRDLGNKRYITIDNKVNEPLLKTAIPIAENSNTPIAENSKHNNIIYNSIIEEDIIYCRGSEKDPHPDILETSNLDKKTQDKTNLSLSSKKEKSSEKKEKGNVGEIIGNPNERKEMVKRLKPMANNVSGQMYHAKKEGYLQRNHKALQLVKKKLKGDGENPEIVREILDWILVEPFWKKQVGSISKLNKTNKEGTPYWKLFLDKTKENRPKVVDIQSFNNLMKEYENL